MMRARSFEVQSSGRWRDVSWLRRLLGAQNSGGRGADFTSGTGCDVVHGRPGMSRRLRWSASTSVRNWLPVRCPPDLPTCRPQFHHHPPVSYKALLLPEPTNTYDQNAIMVVLWAGGSWAKSGYLSREAADTYQPLFRRFGRSGGQPAIACDAALRREDGELQVTLHLGTASECMISLITGDRAPTSHP